VRFVRQVRRYGPLAVGTRWDDQTTILGPPIWLRHTITQVAPPHVFAFAVHLPGGSMVQHYTLADDDEWTLLRGAVRFALPTGAVDAVVGPLLARRLTTMLRDSLATAVRQATGAGAERPAPAGELLVR
jgi:hypothetical protein